MGTLLLGAHAYEIPVPWGQTVKVVARPDCALYPLSDENEVISLSGSTARVQGTGKATFVLCREGKTHPVEVDFTTRCVQEISLAPTPNLPLGE